MSHAMEKVSREGTVAMTDDLSLTRHKAQIRSLANAVLQFRELRATMPVAEVHMFLLVALNEGAGLTELAEHADLRKSTASRYLLNLSDKTLSGAAGHALVIREQDPKELRRNVYTLSDKGKRIVHALVGPVRRVK